MTRDLSRREWLASASAAGCVGLASSPGLALPKDKPQRPFRFCLNTSTIRGKKLPLTEVIDLTARAGYDGIEPWMREIEAHVQAGGKLTDLRKRISDGGLKVESAIGFAQWIVDDEGQRKKGLEQAKRDMDQLRQIGGTHIAAPPVGAHRSAVKDFRRIPERYRALLELGAKMGVVPQLEVWGFSKTLSRLGEVAQVAIDSGHPQACILADVYHLYKGGSAFEGLRLLSGSAMHAFHINDYPKEPPRATINDAQRIYPGDGVAPLKAILRQLHQTGFRGALSLELFNRDYWKKDPLAVVQTGLKKMQAVAEAALTRGT